jgi:hypothetical protein
MIIKMGHSAHIMYENIAAGVPAHRNNVRENKWIPKLHAWALRAQ